ncbi:hypothetical protein [Haloarcula sp. JP-L23]|uniref:hypothetical protein n=1 Tax=Haloarcula sp. JP-L23 TaxID=2716717 RepID=UPI0032E4E268
MAPFYGRLQSLSALVEDHLLVWILLSVGLGPTVTDLAVVTDFSTVILAVMIGSISLTLSVEQFSQIGGRAVALVLLGHAAMPVLAFGIARGLGCHPS